MPIFPVQNSFNGGEWSPTLMGRFDQDRFQNSCRTLKNFIAHPHGSASRRGGWEFIDKSGDHAHRSRLIPFEFGIEQAYALEFGHLYIRFFTASGDRIETGGAPVAVITQYTEDQLRSLRVTQSADVLYIFHQNHPTRKLQRLSTDGTQWQLDVITFLPPPTYEPEMDISGGTISIGLSAVTGQDIKVRASADVFYAADVGRQIKRQVGLASITTYTTRKDLVADIVGDFPSSLIVAGADTVTTSGVTATFVSPHGLAAGDYLVVSGDVRLVVDPAPGGNNLLATLDAAFAPDILVATAWSRCSPIPTGAWFLNGSPNADLTPSGKSPVNSIITMVLAKTGWRTGSSPNGDLGKYVRMFDGIVKITEITSDLSAKGRILVPLVVDPIVAAAGGSWTAEAEAWTAANGYPRAGCFFEQRFMAAGSKKFPTDLWGSASADYENFGLGTYDGDALQYRLAANQVNELMWMMPTKVLLLGTAGSEFRVTGGADAPLTPSNVDAKNEDASGSADVSPARAGHTVIFVQRSGKKVLEIAYSYEPDTFLADNLTEFADHLAAAGIVEIAYQREPIPILWGVRSDGVLLGCTHRPRQKVVAWHWHPTDGVVESICVLPDAANGREALWGSIWRTIDGVDKRFIERLNPDRPNADSFVAYSGAPTTVVTGLDHLEGEAVDVLADGFVVPGHSVSGGMITLSQEASEVVVGLNYESELIPNRAEFVTDKVSTIGRRKHWVEAWVRVHETNGLELNGDELPFRSGDDPLGTATAAYTGDYRVPNLGVDDDVDIIIRQRNPLPATILCVGGTLDVGD